MTQVPAPSSSSPSPSTSSPSSRPSGKRCARARPAARSPLSVLPVCFKFSGKRAYARPAPPEEATPVRGGKYNTPEAIARRSRINLRKRGGKHAYRYSNRDKNHAAMKLKLLRMPGFVFYFLLELF